MTSDKKIPVTVRLFNGQEPTKMYSDSITVSELREQIYAFSGVDPQDMKLYVAFNRTPMGHASLDERQWDLEVTKETNGDQRILEGHSSCYIIVQDTNKDSLIYQLMKQDEQDDGPLFEYSQKDYENRDNTVLRWKQQEQLGRFDSEYNANMAKDLEQQELKASQLQLGERCTVKGVSERRGWLRYVGPVEGLTGLWCGVEFDKAEGKNNGVFKEHTYFGPVSDNHGGFVRPQQVETGTQYVPFETSGSDSDEI